MLIIKISPDEGGYHNIQEQSHQASVWEEGYLQVAPELRSKVFESDGYCDLVIEDGELADIIMREAPERVAPERMSIAKVEQYLREGVNEHD